MKDVGLDFNSVLERVYELPLESKEELKELLSRNIADERRDEIARGFKSAQKEQKAGKLRFSSDVIALKKSL